VTRTRLRARSHGPRRRIAVPSTSFATYAATRGALARATSRGAVLVLPESRSKPLTAARRSRSHRGPRGRQGRGIPAARYWHPLCGQQPSQCFSRVTPATVTCLVRPAGTPRRLCLQSMPDVSTPTHGRTTSISQPSAIYLTIVRVGVMLKFRLSIDEELQELADCWTLADGSEIPPELAKRFVVVDCCTLVRSGSQCLGGRGGSGGRLPAPRKGGRTAFELAAQRSKRPSLSLGSSTTTTRRARIDRGTQRQRRRQDPPPHAGCPVRSHSRRVGAPAG